MQELQKRRFWICKNVSNLSLFAHAKSSLPFSLCVVPTLLSTTIYLARRERTNFFAYLLSFAYCVVYIFASSLLWIYFRESYCLSPWVVPTVLSTTIYLARKEGTEQTFLPKRKRSFILKENGKTSRPAKQKSTVFKPVKECLYEIGPHLIQGITRLKNVRPKPRGIYRTRAKISRAYSKLTRFLDALIFEHFHNLSYILANFNVFKACLWLKYTFKIYCYALVSTIVSKK